MRTNLFLIAGAMFCTLQCYGQWQATGAGTNQFESFYDVESHNSILFASSNSDGLIKSTDNGLTWNAAGQSGFTTNPISVRVDFIVSAGSDLYAVTFNANYSSSMIYKSSDNGLTFVPDTAGLPKVSGNNEVVNVDHIYYHNGNMVVDVANLGNWHKPVSAGSWTQNMHTGTLYAEEFGFYNTTYYAWGSYHLFVSTDNGQNWTQSADANLPPWFTANFVNVNPATGRIYVAGKSTTTNEYRFLYSDNEGASWDSIVIHQYLGLNWLNLPQTVRAIYTNGNYIQIAFENDLNNSHPEVMVSTDGGSSFSEDTVGLPANATQYNVSQAFTLHNGTLFMALNYIDIYKKQLPTGIVDSAPENAANVYPNPSAGTFTITANNDLQEVTVYDPTGKTVVNRLIPMGMRNVTLELIESGLYFISITDRNGTVSIRQIIIE